MKPFERTVGYWIGVGRIYVVVRREAYLRIHCLLNRGDTET